MRFTSWLISVLLIVGCAAIFVVACVGPGQRVEQTPLPPPQVEVVGDAIDTAAPAVQQGVVPMNDTLDFVINGSLPVGLVVVLVFLLILQNGLLLASLYWTHRRAMWRIKHDRSCRCGRVSSSS
jgi:hypothetical protein